MPRRLERRILPAANDTRSLRLAVRVWRYGVVSAVSVGVTQFVLYFSFSIVGWPAVISNILAVCLAAVPAYLLNRRWVWLKRTAHSLTREIVPFWSYNLAGLVLSTLLVGLVDNARGSTVIAVHAANLAAFGVLWLGKFFLLDRVLFAAEHGVR